MNLSLSHSNSMYLYLNLHNFAETHFIKLVKLGTMGKRERSINKEYQRTNYLIIKKNVLQSISNIQSLVFSNLS